MKLPENIVQFLKQQGFVIVSTLDEKGNIHCSAKGVVDVDAEGRIFIIDVYLRKTFENLKLNPVVSITSVDENKFVGFTLQGKAKIISKEDIEKHVMGKWEESILKRISGRVTQSVQLDSKSNKHHEAHLPQRPQYLIEIDVDNIIDLAPPGRKV